MTGVSWFRERSLRRAFFVTGAVSLTAVVGGATLLLLISAHLRDNLSQAVHAWAEEQVIATRITQAMMRQLIVVSALRGGDRSPDQAEFRQAGEVMYEQLRAYLFRDLMPAERLQLETVRERHQEMDVAAARAATLFERGAIAEGQAAFDAMSAAGFAMLDALDDFLAMRQARVNALRDAQARAFRTMHTLGAVFAVVLLLGVGIWMRFLYARVDRPLTDLTAAADQLERGNLSARVGPVRDREFARLAGAFDRMAGSLSEALGAARTSEESFRHLFMNNPLVMWVYDLQTLHFLEVNHAAVTNYGYTREEFLAMRLTDIRPAEDVPRLLADVARDRPALEEAGDWRHRLKNGRIIDVEITSHLLTFDGRSAALVVARDVTRRNEAEAALRTSEERYRGLVEHASFGIFRTGLDGRFVMVNPALAHILGYDSVADLQRVNVETLYCDPTARRDLLQQIRDASTVGDVEVQWIRRDGRPVTLRLRGRPIRDPDGRLTGAEMFAEDVTARREIEEQLRQAQKMEAIGQLTGGIAHDFNNLLSIILSYARFAEDQLPASSPVRGDIAQIHDAGERAARLTRQLLAFGRKQVLEPQVVDLNGVIRDLEAMLRRTLSEHVTVETRLADGLGNVVADPGQLEQVILNLAVNARDAMPDGGTLTVETSNVTLDEAYADSHVAVAPGNYVLLSVSDTGIGMTPEVRERAFEPFFTTKERGKGTGLGLSSVYGIVSQSEGHVWLYSEPGSGTTLKIYLPRADAPVTVQQPAAPSSTAGTETILIAEDEDGVRRAAERALQRAGYRILTAADGIEAATLCERHRTEIKLLLTDVVMPRLSGRDLARQARTIIPGLKVLFMSGYADDAVVHHGKLDPGTHFIGKPFSVDQLRRKARTVLDS